MNSNVFMNIIHHSFAPTLLALGLKGRREKISGKLYESVFAGNGHGVSISFEPGEGLFNVTLFPETNDTLSDIDNAEKTLHLSDLNIRYMPSVSPDELFENEKFFSGTAPQDNDEAILLKMAKELRLTLPKHIARCRQESG